MGGVVPDQLERARIVARDELDLGVVVDRVGEIGERAVDAIATERFASDGEMSLAISRPVMFWGNSRRTPSGKVTATMHVSCCSLAAYERR